MAFKGNGFRFLEGLNNSFDTTVFLLNRFLVFFGETNQLWNVGTPIWPNLNRKPFFFFFFILAWRFHEQSASYQLWKKLGEAATSFPLKAKEEIRKALGAQVQYAILKIWQKRALSSPLDGRRRWRLHDWSVYQEYFWKNKIKQNLTACFAILVIVVMEFQSFGLSTEQMKRVKDFNPGLQPLQIEWSVWVLSFFLRSVLFCFCFFIF